MPALAEATMAAYAHAVPFVGTPITIQRVIGQAPNATTVEAVVPAVTLNDTSRKPSGGEGEDITVNYRQFVVLTADLQAASFPLPVQKDDKVVLPGATHKLNISNADDTTRQLGAAILITASGVA